MGRFPTRRRALSAPLLLAVLAAALPLAPAEPGTSILDDAGNTPALATLVQPGRHTGIIGEPGDLSDYYVFQASKGQELRLALPEGPPQIVVRRQEAGHAAGASVPPTSATAYGFVPVGTQHSLILPADGLWYLHLGPAITPTPYVFEFELRTPIDGVYHQSFTDWQVLEVVADQPAHLQIYSRVQYTAAVDEPSSTMIVEDICQPACRPLGMTNWQHSSAGLGLRIDDVSLAPPSAVTELQKADSSRGVFISYKSFEDFSGAIRFSSFTSDPKLAASVSIVSDAPLRKAEASGSGLVLWDDADSPASHQIMVPGASISGPRELRLDVDDRFIGYFTTHGRDGAARGPDGAAVPLREICTCVILYGPRSGPWRFEVGPGIAAGQETYVPPDQYTSGSNRYLSGAFVPSLGLAPDLAEPTP